MLSILQINIGECRGTHHLMLATAAQICASVLLVSEPNRLLIQNRDHWYSDLSGRAAIAVLGNTAIDAIGPSDNGYRWIEIGGTRIYSCYWSPNLPTHTFEDFLDRLEASARGSRVLVVIAGDFNA